MGSSLNTEGASESHFVKGMGVVRLSDTVAALKQDLAGTQTELLRLRSENTDLRQRLRDATERIDRVRLKGLRVRQSEILAMVRQRQKTPQKTSQLTRPH